MTKSRFIRLFFSILIGVGLAVAITAYQIKNDGGASSSRSGVVAKNFGGDFTLTNHSGETVTQDDFKNQYRLIYFGFTYCPAICPTELQRIAKTLKELGEDGKDIQPIFITVDPERDTVQVMKEYIELFDPRLIGLTGTLEQITAAKKGYKIYAQKVKTEEMNDYTMDHSSFIYFMGPDESLIQIFKADDKIDDMVNVIRKNIKE